MIKSHLTNSEQANIAQVFKWWMNFYTDMGFYVNFDNVNGKTWVKKPKIKIFFKMATSNKQTKAE